MSRYRVSGQRNLTPNPACHTFWDTGHLSDALQCFLYCLLIYSRDTDAAGKRKQTPCGCVHIVIVNYFRQSDRKLKCAVAACRRSPRWETQISSKKTHLRACVVVGYSPQNRRDAIRFIPWSMTAPVKQYAVRLKTGRLEIILTLRRSPYAVRTYVVVMFGKVVHAHCWPT